VAQLPLGFVRKKAAAPRDASTRTPGDARPPAEDPPRSQPERATGDGRTEKSARTVYTVTDLCRRLGRTLEQSHPSFWVGGEISGLRAYRGSGHLYFDLKDEGGKIPCVIWSSNRARVRFEPKDGTEVLCHAKTSLFPRTGKLQLSVFFMEPKGLGALHAELEALRAKLRAEGLTADERKRPLPAFPTTVGVVTSRHGAALHDVLRTLWRRHPGLRVRLAPTPVQGRGAAARIRTALRRLDASGCDVIIVARGGGSLEDLWAFNEEPVARAIAACATPVVTGVGHETDDTLADLVADRRASTPTAAAETVAPVLGEWRARVARAEQRLTRALRSDLGARRRVLEGLAHQLRHPAERHRALKAELHTLEHRLHGAMQRHVDACHDALRALDRRLGEQHPRLRLERARSRFVRLEDRLTRALDVRAVAARHRLAAVTGRLEASSPVAVLARGYAFVTDDTGRVLRRSDDVAPDDPIHVRLAAGGLDATVTAVHPPEPRDDDPDE
jgi:exodeoxyribonuclease VII large subunit